MRIGVNPQKKYRIAEVSYLQQVIIPVYIPHHKAYFKDSFKILRLCINSLVKTVHSATFISIVNNGSCRDVRLYLQELVEEGKIQEVIHTSNIGKVNAVKKAFQGHNFPLITVADADVLFLEGWQEATTTVFTSFEKAGVVGIVPQFKMFMSLSHNLLFDAFFSKKLRFTEVEEPAEMQNFYRSLGWDDDYKKIYLQRHLTITAENNTRAVVGAGHFVATYRQECLHLMDKNPTSHKMGDILMKNNFDTPVLKLGGWRLTTSGNFAYHMGNVFQEWMQQTVAALPDTPLAVPPPLNLLPLKASRMEYFIKIKLFKKLMSYPLVYRFFIKNKGLDATAAKIY